MTETNKQIAATAYQRIFGGLDVTAIDKYISLDFCTISHGLQGAKALVQILISQGVPKLQIVFKHIAAEGDTVFLHSGYEMTGKEWKFIDISRIEN